MKRFVLMIVVAAFASAADAQVRRALVFGLGKQADPSWARIHGDNDVFYVHQMLMKMGYTDVYTLKNEQATKAAMVQAFRELVRRCRKGDVVYIHYSGHGQLMTDLDGDEALKHATGSHRQWDESWIPYDAYMHYGPNDRGEKHLSDDEIALLLSGIRKKIGRRGQLTVVIDACHSGDATCGPDDEPVRGVDTKFSIPREPGSMPPPNTITDDWLTISACKPYQLCMEIKDPQVGKLTYALYKMGPAAFTKGNKDLEQKLLQFMEQHRGRLPQTPMVRGDK